jgi:hypothetical protein
MTRRTTPTHLDEIASLLARGYVRLRQKQAGMHTTGQHSPDDRDISLDAIRQAEPFIGTEIISSTGECQ